MWEKLRQLFFGPPKETSDPILYLDSDTVVNSDKIVLSFPATAFEGGNGRVYPKEVVMGAFKEMVKQGVIVATEPALSAARMRAMREIEKEQDVADMQVPQGVRGIRGATGPPMVYGATDAKPINPQIGAMWYDAQASLYMIYDGEKWVVAEVKQPPYEPVGQFNILDELPDPEPEPESSPRVFGEYGGRKLKIG